MDVQDGGGGYGCGTTMMVVIVVVPRWWLWLWYNPDGGAQDGDGGKRARDVTSAGSSENS